MSAPFDNVFSGKSVFVTGHTGFKGSWLCLWLKRLGARVTGYALKPPTEPSHFELADVLDVLDAHHEADIRDADTLHAAIRRADPDFVLHLAAQTVVRESYRIPRETFDVNVIGTASVLDGVRKLTRGPVRPCTVLCVTSDKCYENRGQLWGYRETDPMGERDPYSGSKGAAELLIHSYRHSYFPPERLAEHGAKLCSARAGNVIGGGDWTADALIVDAVKSLECGTPVSLRAPNAYRPWQHVLEALGGYLTLAARVHTSDDPALCSGWNIGPLPGNEMSVREVVEAFFAEWGAGRWVDDSQAEHLHEAALLHLAIDKAVWKLGWKPCWTTREALRQTARWYQQWFEGPASMRDVSLAQIAEYEASFAASQAEIRRSRGLDALECGASAPLSFSLTR